MIRFRFLLFVLAPLVFLSLSSVQAWTTPERLTNLCSYWTETVDNNTRNIACDNSGRIHIVWHSEALVPGFLWTPQVWYKRYEPGFGWTKDTCIADNPNEASELPGLCVDSAGNLHIVYLADVQKVRYKVWSPITGWSPSEVISLDPVLLEEQPPAIAADPLGNIYVVWTQDNYGYYEIIFRERIGGIWQPRIQLSASNETDKGAPAIAVRDTNVYVVWKGEQPVSGWTHIYYRSRRPSTGWSAITDVTSAFNSDQCDFPGDPYGPSIAVDSAYNVHLVWYGGERDDNYYYRVYYRQRRPSGWLSIDTIAGAGEPFDIERYAPQVVLDRQGNIHVVWFGHNYEEDWYRLWHKKRVSAGWLATEELGAHYPDGDLCNPHIASDTLGCHLIWYDDRYEDEEIFRMASFPLDVEVKAIISPPVFCSLATYTPKAVVRNSGEQEILTPFQVKMTITPGGYEDFQSVNYLGPGDEETLSFLPWMPQEANLYSLQCSLLFADHYPLNNKKSIYCGIPDFVENFEASSGGFISDPPTNAWEWGIPSGVGAPAPYSGLSCWGTNIDGNYANSANWKLNSVWYVATRDTPTLGFYHYYNFDWHIDGGNLKMTTDGTNYTLIHPLTPERYDRKLNNLNVGIPGESAYAMGLPTGWKPALLSVPVRANDTFAIRWHFGSDMSGTDVGWYLDYEGGIGFQPIRYDVGVIEIVVPADTVDSSLSITPTVRLKNFGNRTAQFSAILKIGTYTDAESLTLAPAQESLVRFTHWTPIIRGEGVARCSVYFASDRNPGNDTLNKRFFVRVKDVAVLDISEQVAVAPFNSGAISQLADGSARALPVARDFLLVTDTIDSGDVYIPRSRIANFGNTQVTFWTRYRFGTLHSDSLLVTLLPESETLLNFPPFTVQGRGLVVKKCTTLLSGDLIPENNYKEETTFVRVRDIGIARFISPSLPVHPGELTPEVCFLNYGNTSGSFYANFLIKDSLGSILYTDETTYSYLSPSDSVTIQFQSWLATTGRYVAFCSLYSVNDRVRANDTHSLEFTVSRFIGWVKRQDLTGTTKNVKSGGCIASLDSFVFALVGNNTRDFMRYDIIRNSWQKMESLPPGARGKKVKKGACIASDGYYIYALKGGGTNEFYRYDPFRNHWESLPSPNFIKGSKGGFITLVEQDGMKYLYAGSGANNNEWQRFNISNRTWEVLTPPTLPKDKFKIGSGFAYDGDSILYLTQGGSKYNAFFRINLLAPTPVWESLPNLPLAGRGLRKKKIREGAAIVYDKMNRKVYATKGGNTLEFWQFDPATNSWQQVEDVGSPSVPLRKIKGGGSLTYSSFANGIYATIGNNTNEFWLYGLGRDAVSVRQNLVSANSGQMSISSEIVRKRPVKITIYNLLGEIVYKGEAFNDHSLVEKQSTRLSSGIYILKLVSEKDMTTKKLIITR